MIELQFSLCQVCHFGGYFLQALGPLVKSDALGTGYFGCGDALNHGGGGLGVEELNLFLTVGQGEALGVDLQLGGVVGGIFADVAGGWNPDYTGHTHWRERADVPVVGVGGDGVVGHRFALPRLGKGRGLQGKDGGFIFNGIRVPYCNVQGGNGIFKPRVSPLGALSIITSWRSGTDAPYEDRIENETKAVFCTLKFRHKLNEHRQYDDIGNFEAIKILRTFLRKIDFLIRQNILKL